MRKNMTARKRELAAAVGAAPAFADGFIGYDSPVVDLAASEAAGTITVSWTADGGADNEFLLQSIDGAEWELQNVLAVTSPVSIPGAASGEYRFRVASYTAADQPYPYALSNFAEVEVP